MSGGAKLFLFILLIPFFAAVGHDVYLGYFSSDEKMRQIENLNVDPEAFKISDLGWVWMNRSPSTYQWARENIDADTWRTGLDPILQAPTMLVGLIPFVIGVLMLMIAFVLGFGGGSKYSRNKDDPNTVYKHARGNKFKYSKK